VAQTKGENGEATRRRNASRNWKNWKAQARLRQPRAGRRRLSLF
jgi:hypothetical protein